MREGSGTSVGRQKSSRGGSWVVGKCPGTFSGAVPAFCESRIHSRPLACYGRRSISLGKILNHLDAFHRLEAAGRLLPYRLHKRHMYCQRLADTTALMPSDCARGRVTVSELLRALLDIGEAADENGCRGWRDSGIMRVAMLSGAGIVIHEEVTCQRSIGSTSATVPPSPRTLHKALPTKAPQTSISP